MNIALFGGRFDPPHIGHYLIAQQILELRKDIDQLWFIPAAKHQWKPIVARGEDRLTMLKMFQSKKMKVLDMELIRGGVSYTHDTLTALKKKYTHSFFWIIGADIISELSRWEKADDLTTLTTFLVFPRDPYSLPKKLPKGFELVTNPDLITTNISSTLIRKRIQNKQSIHYLVPKEIEEYITKHKLYV